MPCGLAGEHRSCRMIGRAQAPRLLVVKFHAPQIQGAHGKREDKQRRSLRLHERLGKLRPHVRMGVPHVRNQHGEPLLEGLPPGTFAQIELELIQACRQSVARAHEGLGRGAAEHGDGGAGHGQFLQEWSSQVPVVGEGDSRSIGISH